MAEAGFVFRSGDFAANSGAEQGEEVMGAFLGVASNDAQGQPFAGRQSRTIVHKQTDVPTSRVSQSCVDNLSRTALREQSYPSKRRCQPQHLMPSVPEILY